MKIKTIMMSFSDGEYGKIFKADVITHEGKSWIVPEWLENSATGKMKPVRLILLDSLPHQKIPVGAKDRPADFVLNKPIPMCVFDGQIPHETTFEFHILESPQGLLIDVPKGQTLH